MSMLFMFSLFDVFALQRQGSGAAAGNNKTSGGQGKKKTYKTWKKPPENMCLL